MARRNKRKNQGNRFMFPAAFAATVLLLAALALLYVELAGRKEALCGELKQLEGERSELEKRHLNESEKWTRMKSPRSIADALARHHLCMTWPRNAQVVRLDPADMRMIPVDGVRPDALQVAKLERSSLNE